MKTSSDILFVWKYLKKYKNKLVLIALTGVFYAASKAFIAHYVKQLMDAAQVPANIHSLVFTGIALAFVIALSRYFHIFTMNMVSENVTQDIRQKLQQKFLNLDLKFHSDYVSGSGGLLSRTFNDVKILQDGLRLFADIFTAPLMFIAVLFNLFYFDYKLALTILFITPLILGLLQKLSKTIKKFSIFGVEQLEKITSTIKESLDGVRTIQAFNLEKKFADKLKRQGDEYLAMRRKVHSRVELIGPLNEFVATLILVSIFYYFSKKISIGESSYGILMAYLTTIMQANEPIKKFQEAIVRIQESRVCAQRIEKMILEENRITNSNQNLPFPGDWKTLTYQNISFGYQENKSIIQNFNLTIQKGQTIALVGESGSGKSTLALLLARFYDPQSGSILFDQSLNLKDINLSEIRKNMSIVSQDVFLFSDTLKENILAGHTATDEKLNEVMHASHSYEFIQKLPDQLNSKVSERGQNFSGGEKQRIAIARALIKDAPILILDEATSALDSRSEALVQAGLEKLMQGRTTLIIAHRLSTILKADQILVMKNGLVLEQGNHQELIQKNGEYSKLYKQFT